MLLELIEAPTQQEKADDEYYEELGKSYGDADGRNVTCGY